MSFLSAMALRKVVIRHWVGTLLTPLATIALPLPAWSAVVETHPPSACPSTREIPPPAFAATNVPPGRRFDLSYTTPDATLVEVRLVSKASGGVLLFVGSNHITPPAPDLFTYLEGAFVREKPSESYIEVADVSYLDALPSDMHDVIRTRGEPSYLAFIARQRGVPVLPLEPQASALFAQVNRQFPANEIALAHVLRDVQIARDRRHSFGEALENVAARSIEEQRKIAHSLGQELPFDNILKFTLVVSQLWPGLDWRQVPAEWSNPLLLSSVTGSRFVNAVFARETAMRDRYTLDLLLSRVAAGKRVIALAGRTHVETQLQALTCLMSQK